MSKHILSAIALSVAMAAGPVGAELAFAQITPPPVKPPSRIIQRDRDTPTPVREQTDADKATALATQIKAAVKKAEGETPAEKAAFAQLSSAQKQFKIQAAVAVALGASVESATVKTAALASAVGSQYISSTVAIAAAATGGVTAPTFSTASTSSQPAVTVLAAVNTVSNTTSNTTPNASQNTGVTTTVTAPNYCDGVKSDYCGS